MKLQKFFSICITSMLLLAGCFLGDDKMAGNGSEVENGISGIVYLPDASTVEGAVVTLYPADYNPYTGNEADLLRDTTDDMGRYAFPPQAGEFYNIGARSASSAFSALVANPSADTLILSLAGTITLDTFGSGSNDVYIPGTGIRAVPGAPELSSVPPGIYPIVSRTRGILANSIPVSSGHNTWFPSQIISANRDTYLESSEPNRNSGAKQFLRLKSGGQGIVLLHFDLDTVSVLDSATLWLTVSEFQRDFVNYGYEAAVFGFTSPWTEGTGYNETDPVDGSTYLESSPGIPWPAGFPGSSLDSANRIDVSFIGVRGEQIKHPFPVSGAILQGLKEKTYTAIAIVENSEGYNNADFSSSEGYFPPELYLHEN